jgi:hypothetical protein
MRIRGETACGFDLGLAIFDNDINTDATHKNRRRSRSLAKIIQIFGLEGNYGHGKTTTRAGSNRARVAR